MAGTGQSTDAGPAFLRLDVDEMRRAGVADRSVAGALPVAFLQAALEGTDATVRRQARVELRVHLQPNGTVLVRGRLEGGFVVPCGRCLDDAIVSADTDVCLTFLPGEARGLPAGAQTGEGTPLVELDADDLDVYRYEPPIVDLRPVIGDLWAVAYPMRALCHREDDCRGLCGRCGYALNEVSDGGICCPGCGAPLSEVSQRPSDHGRVGAWKPGEQEAGAWKAALARLVWDPDGGAGDP